MKGVLTVSLTLLLAGALSSAQQRSAPALQAAPPYTIEAIRYATIPQFPLAQLVRGAPRDQQLDIAMVMWLIRGDGKNILFDSGFYRQKWMDQFHVTDFIPPDEAVKQAGVTPDQVTDIIVSHAHWDHMGGLDRFPNATIWIQRAEYDYYTGAAWQPGGRKGGIDADDILELVRRNTRGQVRVVAGDDVEILPGIRVFTGARHAFASQYIALPGSNLTCSLLTTATSTRTCVRTAPAPHSNPPTSPLIWPRRSVWLRLPARQTASCLDTTPRSSKNSPPPAASPASASAAYAAAGSCPAEEWR